MSKPQKSNPTIDVSKYCKSTFTLTFAIEILGIDVWHDCNEGWLDLGPCSQGLKLQYQLYPGQNFDIDIIIWPHVCKIWCGNEYTWVRTWQFLQRRWLSFSITHLFPVRVVELQQFTATLNPVLGFGSLGGNAKNDKNSEVYLPPLQFGERRYFAPVIEFSESLESFMYKLVWGIVTSFIPATIEDGMYNIPISVQDVRHQDAILDKVQNLILNMSVNEDEMSEEIEPDLTAKTELKLKDRRESKLPKVEKKKVEIAPKIKFEIKLKGDEVLAGAGRIVQFQTVGDRPPDLGEVIVLISSFNLPAQDDLPIIFVNVENLLDVPVDYLKKLRINQIYTRWIIDKEIHDSEPQAVRSKKDIKFNDHHALPLQPMRASDITAQFLDKPFEIQLRGTRPNIYPSVEKPTFFGYLKTDRDFGKKSPPKQQRNEETDILIAVTKINASVIAKCNNELVRGEFALYPPPLHIERLKRQDLCTNDMNGIGLLSQPDSIIAPHLILEAQMTLEVSLGLVGCRFPKLACSYSRLYAIVCNRESVLAINKAVLEVNSIALDAGHKSDVLSGFAVDTNDVVVFYIEGPRDGTILKIWELTADFYPAVKPLFCSAARYHERIYETMAESAVPYLILRMYVPLGVLLACPPVYARPALPILARTALLKLGRLVQSKLADMPSGSSLPSEAELNSFGLELCTAPRTAALSRLESDNNNNN